MTARVFESIDDVKPLVGQSLGASEWRTVTQDQVNAFGQATGDLQWIHTDPERAARESPYHATIAHGFFMLALCAQSQPDIFVIRNMSLRINYGLNRVRFPAPVIVGTRVRLATKLAAMESCTGGVQVTLAHTIERENEEKPACAAEGIERWLV